MDSPSIPDNGPTSETMDPNIQDIYFQAQACKSLFTSYLEPSGDARVYQKNVYEAERRFLTWASFLGVFASEGASLDNRLRYAPEVKDLVLSMLQVLRRNLERSIIRHSRGSASSITIIPPENDGAMYGISGAIDRLQRLAMAIRQSPRTDEVDRVRNFASKQPADGFYNIVLAMIQFLFGDAERALQNQLAETITYRRHRLLWNRRHSKKLGRQRKEKEEAQPLKKKQHKPVLEPELGQNSRTSSQPRFFSGAQTGSILSSTQFSQRPLGRILDKNLLRVQGASQQEENRSVRSSNPPPKAQYPERPPVAAGETKVMCQYCLTGIEIPITASEKLKDTIWRNHLDADLQPYVCVSEECGSFPTSFSNVKEWKSHMHNNHRTDWNRYIHRVTWRCPYCRDDSGIFLAKDLLIRHLTENQEASHAVVTDKLELAKIVAKSTFVAPRSANECPLCGSPPWNDPGRMSKERDTSSDLPDDVEKHFVSHLQHLALLSLLWWDNDIGLVMNEPDGGEDSDDIVGFNSNKSWNLEDESDIIDRYSWLDLDTDAMERVSELRARLEMDGQSLKDALVQNLGPLQDQLQLQFSNTQRQLEELRDVQRRDDQTALEELFPQLEFLSEQLRLGVESLLAQTNRSQLITGVVIEPSYTTDQQAGPAQWRGVLYSKLSRMLQDAQDKVQSKRSPSQKSSDFDRDNSAAFPSSVHSLADAILDSTVESCFNDRSSTYLPEGRIHELVSPEVIVEELPSLDAESVDDLDLFNFILADAKKILGICVLLELRGESLQHIMRLFHYSGFDDRMLPVSAVIREQSEEIPAPFNKMPWSISMRRSFFEMQWIFLAPVFLSNSHRDFEDDCTLPITWQSEKWTRQGHSSVSEAKFHPNHFQCVLPTIGSRLTEATNDYLSVAITQLSGENLNPDVQWALEHYPKFSHLTHQHFTQMYGSFSLQWETYFLFEWADRGNLRNLWTEPPKTSNLNPDHIKETVVQLRGLAEALLQMHQEGCIYGNLKPENILCFRNGPTYIGTLKFATPNSALFRFSKHVSEGQVKYQAPEATFDVQSPGSHITEIWSIGCIVTEHLIWLLYGTDELSRFNRGIPSSFFDIGAGGEPIVHPWVMTWIDHMSNDQECTGATALGDLLELIRTKLLVPSPQKINPAGIHRVTAKLFSENMAEISIKVIDERYLYTGKKRENVKGPQDDSTKATYQKIIAGFLRKLELDAYFPLQGSSVLDTIVSTAVSLHNRGGSSVFKTDSLENLIKFSLYQPVILCDDSSSMKRQDRWECQRDIVTRIASVSTRLLPDTNGVHLRFFNANPSNMDNLQSDTASRILSEVYPRGDSQSGTSLREKILEPMVYRKMLDRPLFVVILTDGWSDPWDDQILKQELLECRKYLLARGFPPHAVIFQLHVVGNDRKALRFLDSLAMDEDLQETLYLTSERLDSKLKELRENEMELNAWLLLVLVSPLIQIEANYKRKDTIKVLAGTEETNTQAQPINEDSTIAASGMGSPHSHPKTNAEFVTYVRKVLQDTVAEQFLKNNSKFIEELAGKAAALGSDPGTPICGKDLLPKTIQVTMHQQVLYCDDSSSMQFEDHWGSQMELIKRIARVTTWILPEGKGIYIRYINQQVPNSSLQFEDLLDVITTLRCRGITSTGTKLREKVLEPLVYSKLPSDLKRPLLVSVITDGKPDRELVSTFVDAIIECGDKLEAAGLPRVKFMIGQVGSAQEATQFLQSIGCDPRVADVVFVAPERLDVTISNLKSEWEKEKWLIETLYATISKSEKKINK
ncbi:hypothetical protein NUW58_g4567 [Xylaria curta]|uniref:Uncharacterized protein n=1 Tax=Xylaria curta TaxID=42375 RepID=A0ACC1P8U7_9PEZI|nr:hypothetical protein NUW58_g4567 [Xylaria curta]